MEVKDVENIAQKWDESSDVFFRGAKTKGKRLKFVLLSIEFNSKMNLRALKHNSYMA